MARRRRYRLRPADVPVTVTAPVPGQLPLWELPGPAPALEEKRDFGSAVPAGAAWRERETR